MSDLPIGGSTGLCHESSHAIDQCAEYLVSVPPEARPRPLVPAMKEMFDLNAAGVCEAIRQSHQLISARST